jgi:hypothetical protein
MDLPIVVTFVTLALISTTPAADCQMVYFLNQKSKFWVNFGGPYNGRCRYILCPSGIQGA